MDLSKHSQIPGKAFRDMNTLCIECCRVLSELGHGQHHFHFPSPWLLPCAQSWEVKADEKMELDPKSNARQETAVRCVWSRTGRLLTLGEQWVQVQQGLWLSPCTAGDGSLGSILLLGHTQLWACLLALPWGPLSNYQ